VLAAVRGGTEHERTEAEEALRESEERHRTIFEESADAVTLLDEQAFLDCNKAALDVFGCSQRSEFVGRHPSEMSPPTQSDGESSQIAAQRRIHEAYEKGSNRFEWLHRRIDGELFHAEVVLTAFRFRGQRLLQAVVRDISDRKRAEERQARMTRNLREVAGIADELLATPDMDTLLKRAVELPRERLGLERCSIFLVEDDGFRGTYGTDGNGLTTDERDVEFAQDEWRRELVESDAHSHSWHSEKDELVSWNDGQCVHWGEGWVAWPPIVGRSGPTGVFFNDSAMTGAPLDETTQEVLVTYCTLLGNIIERRRVEDALRESEDRYRLLAENATDVIWTMDMDMRVTYVSPSSEQRSGYTLEERVGKTLDTFVTPASAETAKTVFAGALAQEARRPGSVDSRVIELEILHKDGTTFWAEMSAGFLRDETGRPVGIIGVARDITDRREAEKALRESEERYRLLTEQSVMGVVILHNDSVAYANEAASDIFGYSPGLPVVLMTGFSSRSCIESADDASISRFLMNPCSVAELAQAIGGAIDA